jgi:hypothetical protein
MAFKELLLALSSYPEPTPTTGLEQALWNSHSDQIEGLLQRNINRRAYPSPISGR